MTRITGGVYGRRRLPCSLIPPVGEIPFRTGSLRRKAIRTLIILAGIGHLLLVAGSPFIPPTLGWREDTAKLKLLTRQVFWTWAGYVWITHLCFGLIATFGSHLLVDGSPLAGFVCSFISAWWFARIVIQFTYFDRSARPPGAIYVLAEVALITFFGGCAGVFGWAAYTNFM